MDLTVAVHFPHRQFHATPWDQAANSGSVEWPPSPWRLARALLSVWHTRYPEVGAEAMERLVGVFGRPPEYRVPPAANGHTRHYMPLLDHKSDETGATTLTLDSYVGVDPSEALLITWRDVHLDEHEMAIARDLWASLPYLGRAESICRAELRDGLPEDGSGQVWRPLVGGGQRLMCVAGSATLPQVQITPTAMRKGRTLTPEGSEWVEYENGELPVPRPSVVPAGPRIFAARWRLVAPAPFPEALGLWATDRLRFLTLKRMGLSDDPATRALHGHESVAGTPTLHRHAHWLWTTAGGGQAPGGGATSSGRVNDVVVWVPDGVPSSLLASMVGRRLTVPNWAPKGFVEADLALVGFGGPEVIQDLGAQTTTTQWVSATPYLMTRHMKRKRDFLTLLREDIDHELVYRFGAGAPRVVSVSVDGSRRLEALSFRQQRIGERRRRARSKPGEDGGREFHQREALFVAVTFDREVPGPLLLGHLSHFGFGRFAPSL